MTKGHLRKKVSRTPSQQTSQKCWCSSKIPAIQEAWTGGSCPKAEPGKQCETLFENNLIKKSFRCG
jgi:hypothetical protein